MEDGLKHHLNMHVCISLHCQVTARTHVHCLSVILSVSRPVRAPRAVEFAQSGSWPDGIKDDLIQALVSLDLVLLMLVVVSDCCLGFCVVVWL